MWWASLLQVISFAKAKQASFDWPDVRGLTYAPMILDKHSGFEVYIWWTGEKTLVDAESFESFSDKVCLRTECNRGDILFILQDGHEMNAENFQVAKLSKDKNVFAFLVCKSSEIQSLLKFPQVPRIPQFEVNLPSYASPGSTIDLQLARLQDRLEAIKRHLVLMLEATESLFRYEQSVGQTAEVMLKSSGAARQSLELHLLLSKGDIEFVISTAVKQLDSVDALLHRCPLDFAMMKRIPVKQGVLAVHQKENQTLFDVQNAKWHDLFRECQEIRDTAFSLKESMEREYQRVVASLSSGISETSLDATRSPSVVPQLVDELRAAIDEISVSRLEEHLDEAMSENLLLVQKSGKLLSLAELVSKYSEGHLKALFDRLRKLFELQSQESNFLEALYAKTKRNIDDVIAAQESLADILTAKVDMLEYLDALQSREAMLDEIHAFPVAYVALLCELVKRTTFETRLKDSFCSVEKKLASALNLELQRREEFKRQITSLIDIKYLGSTILDSRLDGNIVLFINETQPFVSLQDIEDLERLVKEDISTLSSEDPISLQLCRFLETLVQMKRRSTVIPDDPNLEKSACSPSVAGESEVLKTYEERIKNLERLLQENYAAARGIQRRSQGGTEISQQVCDLSESIMRLTGDNTLPEWKAALIEVAQGLGVSAGHEDPVTLKTDILSAIAGAEKKISVSRFSVGELVLILPTVRSGVWSLFNVNEPHYYLHPQSLARIRQAHDAEHNVDWLLGRISNIKTKVSQGKSRNPYRLPKNLCYFEVYATPYDPSQDKQK